MIEKEPFPTNIDIIKVLKNSNLTPSQKVSVITEINNKSQSSRNLAHVPCKFFRQGTCQAGNSCPFSHDVQSPSDLKPCKYFQKGNCKFGSKCALAHITSDGKRVNHQKHSHSHSNTSSKDVTSAKFITIDNQFNDVWENPQYQPFQPTIEDPNPFNANHQPHTHTYSSSTIATSPLENTQMWNNTFTQRNSFSGTPSVSQNSNYFTSNSIPTTAQSYSSPSQLAFTQDIQSQYPDLNNLQTSHYITNSIKHVPSDFDIPSTQHNSEPPFDFDPNDPEDIDYIPSSLVDLLTPQEVRRRNSRSSFGSGSGVSYSQALFATILEKDTSETPFVMD